MLLYNLAFEGKVYVPADNEKQAMQYFSNIMKLLEDNSFVDFDGICVKSIINNEG